MAKRIATLVFIYACIVVAWFILGGTMTYRTYDQNTVLRDDVGQLWGDIQRQNAPRVTYQEWRQDSQGEIVLAQAQPTQLEASDITVDLDLEHRRRGLLWYATYEVDFAARYTVANPSSTPWTVALSFSLPDYGATYDDFRLVVGETAVADISIVSGAVQQEFDLAPGQRQTVAVAYRSRGMDEWWYNLGSDVTQVKDLRLVLNTNFAQIDFPATSMSPVLKERTAQGWQLTWDYANLLSGRPIAMVLPHLLNPGPWASNIIFFAPVSLFLFFFLLFLFTTVRGVKIHPMNYFFLGAAYFSYHLLLAYLVDHVSIHLSFWICSAVSILLVVSYMRLVVGARFALVEVGISQFVYLVLFSYTFFFEGYTGLVITILCIVTLFVVMQFTGRVDWESVFRKGSGTRGHGQGLAQPPEELLAAGQAEQEPI